MRAHVLFATALISCGDNLPIEPDGPHYQYVISQELLPIGPDALIYSIDLDGDGAKDNALPSVLGLLQGELGFDVQGATNERIGVGDILILADLQTTGFSETLASGLRLYDGSDARPEPCDASQRCGRHLLGTGEFSIAEDDSHGAPFIAPFVDGTFLSGARERRALLRLGMPNAPLMTFPLIGARVEITSATEDHLEGTFGGAIVPDDLEAFALPSVLIAFEHVVARDCAQRTAPPTCGCATGSRGSLLLRLFDAIQPAEIADCAIGAKEVLEEPLVYNWLRPDVRIAGQDATSIGLGFRAVRAEFTP